MVAAAWFLGVLMATGGSFLAVDGLAHGLLGPATQHLAVAPIQGVPVVHQASSSQPVPALSLAAGDDGDKDAATPRVPPAASASPPAPQATQSPSSASGGSLVVSPGGTVSASCQNGLAYLQYWSPSPGYQADDVIRGPAARASIGFEHLASEYVISVTCSGSKPVAKVTAG